MVEAFDRHAEGRVRFPTWAEYMNPIRGDPRLSIFAQTLNI